VIIWWGYRSYSSSSTSVPVEQKLQIVSSISLTSLFTLGVASGCYRNPTRLQMRRHYTTWNTRYLKGGTVLSRVPGMSLGCSAASAPPLVGTEDTIGTGAPDFSAVQAAQCYLERRAAFPCMPRWTGPPSSWAEHTIMGQDHRTGQSLRLNSFSTKQYYLSKLPLFSQVVVVVMWFKLALFESIVTIFDWCWTDWLYWCCTHGNSTTLVLLKFCDHVVVHPCLTPNQVFMSCHTLY
jgi:hypothetical protein